MPGCRTPDRPSCTVVPGTLGHDTCAEDSCLKRVIINAADPFTGLDDPLFAPDMIILTWVGGSAHVGKATRVPSTSGAAGRARARTNYLRRRRDMFGYVRFHNCLGPCVRPCTPPRAKGCRVRSMWHSNGYLVFIAICIPDHRQSATVQRKCYRRQMESLPAYISIFASPAALFLGYYRHCNKRASRCLFRGQIPC